MHEGRPAGSVSCWLAEPIWPASLVTVSVTVVGRRQPEKCWLVDVLMFARRHDDHATHTEGRTVWFAGNGLLESWHA